ncbi:MAG: PIN domain-containing protein, partial [Phycicoccus sp.]
IENGLDVIPGHLAISVVSMAELQFGVLVARDDGVRAHRLRRLARLRRTFDPLPVDDAVADCYGELAARVVRRGRQPRARQFDLLIAATARVHDARLVTRNPADFRGLEDLVEVVAP